MSDDPFDLGIDPEHTYDDEWWPPSADYPQLTSQLLRRTGATLEIRTTPPHGLGAPYVRRATIAGVWRHLGRAELVFEGAGAARELFDLRERRIATPDAGRHFVTPAPLGRDARDPSLWLELFAVLSEEVPRLDVTLAARAITRGELEAVPWKAATSGVRTARARWPAPAASWTPRSSWSGDSSLSSPPGYGLEHSVEPELERIDCFAEGAHGSLLAVAMWPVQRRPAAHAAQVQGVLGPELAALDAAVARLLGVLAGGGGTR